MKKILLAESSSYYIDALKKSLSEQYEILLIEKGSEAWQQIQKFQPDLVILDLMLPEMHGIELTKLLRAHSATKNIGVIITSSFPLVQNYHAALEAGANYFLEKPYTLKELLALISQYFSEGLEPSPFEGKKEAALGEHCYLSKHHSPNSYIKFWGTRGSCSVSGHEYVRFGGNTVCLEVRHKGQVVIIDAGTGIRALGRKLHEENQKEIHILIGHTHWDHITGIPFFDPLYDPTCHIHFWTPVGFGKTTKELFTDMLAYAFFPVRFEEISAKITFHELRDNTPYLFGEIGITAHYAYHPGPTFCFKIQAGEKIIGYATDNEIFMGYHGSPLEINEQHPLLLHQMDLVQFYKGCDIMVHEAQYTPFEYLQKAGWGHSSIANATLLMKFANLRHWIVTHHDPIHTDEDLQRILQIHHDIIEDCQIFCRVEMAFDGLTIPIE